MNFRQNKPLAVDFTMFYMCFDTSCCACRMLTSSLSKYWISSGLRKGRFPEGWSFICFTERSSACMWKPVMPPIGVGVADSFRAGVRMGTYPAGGGKTCREKKEIQSILWLLFQIKFTHVFAREILNNNGKWHGPCIPLGTWHQAPHLWVAGSSHRFPSPTSMPEAALESCSSGDLQKTQQEVEAQ